MCRCVNARLMFSEHYIYKIVSISLPVGRSPGPNPRRSPRRIRTRTDSISQVIFKGGFLGWERLHSGRHPPSQRDVAGHLDLWQQDASAIL